MTLRMIRRRDARGMVTAELAVTTLAAFAVLTMMCWGIYLVVTQLRCVDAAAAVARQAARDDDSAVVKAKAGAKATDQAIHDYPYASLGISFAAGMLLGVILKRR